MRDAALAVVASALLYWLSAGLGEVGAAAWLAPFPVLLFAFRASWRAAAAAAWAAFFLGSLNLFSYLSTVMPLPAVFPVLVLPAAVFALAVLAARFAFKRLSPWLAVFAFPAAWTSYEFLTSLVSPHGTSLSLAYSQTGFPPVLQVVTVTGLWGVTFLVTLAPAAAAAAWAQRSFRPLAVPAAIVAVALAFGFARLRHADGQGTVTVGLAATDRGLVEAFATQDPAVALRVVGAYADRVRRLAAQGARIVVLPEKFVGVTPADSAAVRAILADAARASGVTLVAGLNLVGIQPRRNVAVVFGPDGRQILEHDKRHMLPGPETGYAVGLSPGLFAAPGAPWGVAICQDMDFPAWSRQYGLLGVRLLAVPAWDFVLDDRLHARMAIVRAVENGFAMVRTAQQGLLTVNDGYGRILAEKTSGRGPEALLTQAVAPGPGATLYTRFGDWFGWVSVLALAVLLARAGLR